MYKRQIKQNRLKKHFLYWCDSPYFHSNLSKWENYNPEEHIDNFLEYQTNGNKNLIFEQLEGIYPLINGQKSKEITINSIVMETFEWDSRGWGWIYPINNILLYSTDRLTKLALLKIKRRLSGYKEYYGFGNRLEFYLSHPIRELWKSEFNKCLNRFIKYYNIEKFCDTKFIKK